MIGLTDHLGLPQGIHFPSKLWAAAPKPTNTLMNVNNAVVRIAGPFLAAIRPSPYFHAFPEGNAQLLCAFGNPA